MPSLQNLLIYSITTKDRVEYKALFIKNEKKPQDSNKSTWLILPINVVEKTDENSVSMLNIRYSDDSNDFSKTCFFAEFESTDILKINKKYGIKINETKKMVTINNTYELKNLENINFKVLNEHGSKIKSMESCKFRLKEDKTSSIGAEGLVVTFEVLKNTLLSMVKDNYRQLFAVENINYNFLEHLKHTYNHSRGNVLFENLNKRRNSKTDSLGNFFVGNDIFKSGSKKETDVMINSKELSQKNVKVKNRLEDHPNSELISKIKTQALKILFLNGQLIAKDTKLANLDGSLEAEKTKNQKLEGEIESLNEHLSAKDTKLTNLGNVNANFYEMSHKFQQQTAEILNYKKRILLSTEKIKKLMNDKNDYQEDYKKTKKSIKTKISYKIFKILSLCLWESTDLKNLKKLKIDKIEKININIKNEEQTISQLNENLCKIKGEDTSLRQVCDKANNDNNVVVKNSRSLTN